MTRDEALASIRAGVEAFVAGGIGLVDGGDPFVVVAETPALDALGAPADILEPAALTGILTALDEARTDDERLAEVIAWLARVGAVLGGLV